MNNLLGTLYGIGVGTGDPELITIKGLRLIQSTSVIAFPAGMKGKPGIAQQIIEPWLQQQQIRLALDFPYVQDNEILSAAWNLAAQEVWEYLQRGDVVFVSEGDISFYSTFTYLAETLQQLHPEVVIQKVPGIASPMAAAAVLGIPLTIVAQRLAILPALYNMGELEKVLEWADVVVLMKVSSVYEKVWDVLKRWDLLDRAYVVERATLPNQVIYSGLGDRPTLNLPYFSLLIVQVR